MPWADLSRLDGWDVKGRDGMTSDGLAYTITGVKKASSVQERLV